MLVPYNVKAAHLAKPMQESVRRVQGPGRLAVHALQPAARDAVVYDVAVDLELGLARIDDALTVVDRYVSEDEPKSDV